MSLTELFEKIGHDGSIRLKVWIEDEKDEYIDGYLCALEDLKITLNFFIFHIPPLLSSRVNYR